MRPVIQPPGIPRSVRRAAKGAHAIEEKVGVVGELPGQHGKGRPDRLGPKGRCSGVCASEQRCPPARAFLRVAARCEEDRLTKKTAPRDLQTAMRRANDVDVVLTSPPNVSPLARSLPAQLLRRASTT